jgi:hypothetical protein
VPIKYWDLTAGYGGTALKKPDSESYTTREMAVKPNGEIGNHQEVYETQDTNINYPPVTNKLQETSRKNDIGWFWSFVGLGALMALPIPTIGWLWLIIGIYRATKLGWKNGLLGIAILFSTGVSLRLGMSLVLGLLAGIVWDSNLFGI